MTTPVSTRPVFTVHSVLPDGRRVIREDRANKWYVENVSEGTRKNVNLSEAVDVAIQGSVRFGMIGGTVFDARVRSALEARRNLW